MLGTRSGPSPMRWRPRMESSSCLTNIEVSKTNAAVGPEGNDWVFSAGTTRDYTTGHPGVHTEPFPGLAFRAQDGFPGRYKAVTTTSCRAALITTSFP